MDSWRNTSMIPCSTQQSLMTKSYRFRDATYIYNIFRSRLMNYGRAYSPYVFVLMGMLLSNKLFRKMQNRTLELFDTGMVLDH